MSILRDDPDTVLEGYSALWHVDRTSLVVSASDILVGEDGNEDFTAADAFYDSVSISLNQAPLTAITVDATVAWEQVATGVINLGGQSFLAMSTAIVSGWPEAGRGLGAGWSVHSSSAVDVRDIEHTRTESGSASWSNTETRHSNGDTMSISRSWSFPVFPSTSTGFTMGGVTYYTAPMSEYIVTFWEQIIGMVDPYADPPVNNPASSAERRTYIPSSWIQTSLAVQYDAKRSRTERVTFTLKSDLQDVVTIDADTPDQEIITLSGAGDLPIGDYSRRSYFPTDRGLWSLEYLIALARAHLMQRSRVVEVSFDCRFERAINLSCRKNARLFDPRLPGGQALGKIIAYTIKGDGDAGVLIGNVTIGCAVGYGNAVEAVEGEPSYVEAGYVESGYQFYADAIVVLPTSDVGYSTPIDEAADDGLVFPLDYRQVVVRNEIVGLDQPQPIEVAVTDVYTGEKTVTAGESPVYYELELRPVVNGPFGVEYAIDVSELTIPKMIDLEAAAV